MQESSWVTPSPTTEAHSMLGLAQLVGADAVRRLILVTDEQKAELHKWAHEEPLLAEKIRAVILFREQVLILFEKLLEREEQKERAA